MLAETNQKFAMPEQKSRNQPLPAGQLASVLAQMGCPASKSNEMAAQLIRRAAQLAKTTGRAETEAMRHLLELMRQGWAARKTEDGTVASVTFPISHP